MGDYEIRTPVLKESPLGYHPSFTWNLTSCHELVIGQCQVGSLTGAVASERVTEAFKGQLNTVRNRVMTCKGVSWLDCKTDRSSRRESGT